MMNRNLVNGAEKNRDLVKIFELALKTNSTKAEASNPEIEDDA
jgi:hypothetical protein